MDFKKIKKNIQWREIAFMTILHILLFLFYISDNKHSVTFHDIVFFLSYAIAAWVINYKLLPLYYYRKKYIFFIVGIAIILNISIIVEEFVLEQLFFPDSQGTIFPGYFHTLFEFLPLIAILVGAKFAWDAHIKQREVDTLKTEVKASELQFLKSQINPHFLFNNLNNLYSSAITEGATPKTASIILELSAVLRYMLYDCEEDYVLLNKEIEQLQSFVALNDLQIVERGTIIFNVTPINRPFVIAPLILMVFIENAFKHSISSQTNDILIEISITISDDGLLNFNCKNSFSEQKNTDDLPHGIGLQNVIKRLQLLYPESHKLNTNLKNGTYSVQLELQLTKE
ncbi:MAG: histidine kinase [Flavobacteriaceae bacterium]